MTDSAMLRECATWLPRWLPLLAVIVLAVPTACDRGTETARAPATATPSTTTATAEVVLAGERGAPHERSPSPRPWSAVYRGARDAMVEHQIADRGITDARVLAAMRRVPRHAFVPAGVRDDAYQDWPLPIGHGQTISQPFIVAYMTEALAPEAGDRVLEVGTGSGYQAAVLAELVSEVVTIEIVDALARSAAKNLEAQGYTSVTVLSGDGYAGWPARAPYDAIIITAAPERIPGPLIEQLAPGGRLLAPVGPQDDLQYMTLVLKDDAGEITERKVLPVRFVPLTRERR